MAYNHKLRLGAFFSCLATMAWVTADPGWDALIALAASLLVFVTEDLRTLQALNDGTRVQALLGELPSSRDPMRFIRQQDFLGRFDLARITKLHDFVDRWEAPELDFLNPRLKAAKEHLLQRATDFLAYLRTHTSDNCGQHSVIPRDHLLEATPEMKEEAAQLNRLAEELSAAHKHFVRTALRPSFLTRPALLDWVLGYKYELRQRDDGSLAD